MRESTSIAIIQPGSALNRGMAPALAVS